MRVQDVAGVFPDVLCRFPALNPTRLHSYLDRKPLLLGERARNQVDYDLLQELRLYSAV